jgi:hypothetical protein
MEKRKCPRRTCSIKAFFYDPPSNDIIESRDVSAAGVYFSGDPHASEGSTVHLRMEISVKGNGDEKTFPVDGAVEVVRITKGSSGEVVGFGGRWIRVFCKGEISPVIDFLRSVLGVTGGFVQTIAPETASEPPYYVFQFPTSERGVESPVKPFAETEAIKEESEARASRTGIYVVLPLRYRVGKDEFEGRAVKLRSNGLRIATNGLTPDVYSKIAIIIPTRHRQRLIDLELSATVTTVRAVSPAAEAQFEVEFSLANDAEKLMMYRRILDRLNESLSAQKKV